MRRPDPTSAGGLPKKTETCLFFQIDKEEAVDFRKQLTHLLPMITTSAQVVRDRGKIDDGKKESKGKGKCPPLLKLTGVNIAFSQAGLAMVYFHTFHKYLDKGRRAESVLYSYSWASTRT